VSVVRESVSAPAGAAGSLTLEPLTLPAHGDIDIDGEPGRNSRATRASTAPGAGADRAKLLTPLGKSRYHQRSLPQFRRKVLPLTVYPDASGGRPELWNRVNITTKAVKNPWGDDLKEDWVPMREAWAAIAADPSGQTLVERFLKPALPSLRNRPEALLSPHRASGQEAHWSSSSQSDVNVMEMEEVFGSFAPYSSEGDNAPRRPSRRSSNYGAGDASFGKDRGSMADELSPPAAAMRMSLGGMHRQALGDFAQLSGGAGPRTDAHRVAQVFHRLEKGKQITVGKDLSEAMNWLGHPYPAAVWLQEAINAKCLGRSSLDLEDFTEVVAIYEEKLNGVLLDVFRSCAGDRQVVDMMEVPDMLVRSGVPFMPGAYTELVADFRTNSEKRGNHKCDFNMFKIANNKVMWRAGLTRAEAEFLTNAFESYAKDGHISQENLVQALTWGEPLLELAGGRDALVELANEVANRSAEGRVSLNLKSWETPMQLRANPGGVEHASRGMLSRTDFFAAARVQHGRVEQGLRALISKLGRSPDQPMGITLLTTLFEFAGFYGALEDTVQQFLNKLHMQDHGLTFEQVYAAVLTFCKADGMTPGDLEEVEETFRKFDLDGSRTLELEELGPVLRWLGYQPSQYRVYDFAETFGLEESSEITLDDFIKLSSSYMTMSLYAVRNVFLVRADGAEYQRLPASRMEELLHLVGYDPTQQELEILIDRAGGRNSLLSFRQFKVLEREHRRRVKESMERNGGYTDKDLERYRRYFEANDPGDTGFITHKAMRELFLQLFPDTKENSQRHAKIVQMVTEADADGNKQIDFDEYVTLFRGVTQEMDRDILQRGLKLKKQLGYTRAEVKQFRELYNASDADLSGSVDTEELASIFSNLIHMHKEAQRELKEIVEGFSTNGALTFWQFLSLMSHVQKINWRDINDLAGN